MLNTSYAQEKPMQSIYDFTVKTIDGQESTLDTYRGRVMLIVNVASKCGYTSQYDGLETLYETYKDRGLVILGFPCNQFAGQEPGSEAEILNFCRVNYGVTFPMFAKINVNGENADPLYDYLKERQPGLFGIQAIKWNFTKFLIDREGNVIERFAPNVPPASMAKDIESLL